eukprot:CAMPEP_0114439868 /NCGR_PEP_ID=MMETSP0103-20121206/15442_1 /TAXON_ID=37642 ORGANISM="Paraphysomonas imperforata, Strain PA2" /NCGR_SAMPLE_ID=MMETSP0103 /ASSEMBLY_ACC=CAM_ASM_000201 /LENGTH=366 /DNA_ID=CAMNT_0001610687 /DNA_START=99 /DNA_END=1195 /DNA_ORIENTATION=+
MSRSLKKGLSIKIHDITEDSFIADGDIFVKDNLAINASGIAMRNNPKTFNLEYEELEIGETIGRGCSSVVLHGIHAPTGTHLALKVINMFDKSKRDQLIREIRSLYDAQCSSLITFYGSFYRDSSITIALEYMDGGSLANVVHQVGAIPEGVLASITFQILWGLAYLYHEKRVHRDIKPSNLLINSLGEVKVTDFGVSAVYGGLAYLYHEKRVHRDIKPSNLLINSLGEVKVTDFGVSAELQNSIAMCGTFVGTFKYMSPERIKNQPYSYQSDIWSFGLVLMECATGRYPFQQHSNCIDMAQTILDCDIPPLSPKKYSAEFIDFAGLCLQRDPRLRPPAEVLLTAPWLQMHGIDSYDTAVSVCRNW